MFGKKQNLRDLLSEKEAHSVDALLRRVNTMLATTGGLSSAEKAEVVDGVSALKRVFYEEKSTDRA